MAVDAKMRMISNMKKKLSDYVTSSNTEKIIDLLADELAHYRISFIDSEYSENDDLLEAYLNALTIEGRSQKTIDRYRYVVGRFLNYVKIPTREISVYDVRRYLGAEKIRGISESTLDGIRQVFSAYFSWLHREGLISKNPIGNIGSIKSKKTIKRIYSEVDMEKMKLACCNIRDRAIITFLASTGCRISEVTGLNRSSVDFSSMECKVLGKGNKERIVYIDPIAGMALSEYLKRRTDDNEALFIGKGNNRLLPGGVRTMLKKVEERSGVDHVHPHKFRRTLATNLIRRGMPIEEVAAILGHDKLDTTMQYVVLDKSDIKNAYRKYAS